MASKYFFATERHIVPGRIIASFLALAAFAVAITAGLAAGNPVATTLWRALLAMAGGYVIGRIIGYVAQRAVHQHIEQYKQDHPLQNNNPAPASRSDEAESDIQPGSDPDSSAAGPTHGAAA